MAISQPALEMQEFKIIEAPVVNSVMEAVSASIDQCSGYKVNLRQTMPQRFFQPNGDLTAVIDILHPGGDGFLSISMGINFANRLVAGFIGVPPSHMTSEIRADGVGEFANIIGGVAVRELVENGCSQYKIGLPIVTAGRGHHPQKYRRELSCLFLEYWCEGELFNVQICF